MAHLDRIHDFKQTADGAQVPDADILTLPEEVTEIFVIQTANSKGGTDTLLLASPEGQSHYQLLVLLEDFTGTLTPADFETSDGAATDIKSLTGYTYQSGSGTINGTWQ